jgi:hypothetical protein
MKTKELRDLLTICDDKEQAREIVNVHSNHLPAIIAGIKDETCTAEQCANDEVFFHDRQAYSHDSYCITLEGDVRLLEDVAFCEYHEEHTSDFRDVYVGRGQSIYSETAVSDAGLHEYRGDYYDDDALEYHDLVVMYDGDITHIDNAYFWESDQEYHYEPEEEYVIGYHDGERGHVVKFTENPKFFIGYEIEKEDEDVRNSLMISEFNETCPYWIKERDGSLDSDTGFELVSPIFELAPDKIRETIKDNKTLMRHINADKSERCGGHINVSESGLSGMEFFDKVKGYTPLFYALYFGRVNKDYSKGKSNADLKNDNAKYQAIRIHSNRIEIRIISAVPNFDTLMWRTRLIEYICNNPTDCPRQSFLNFRDTLKPLIQEQYTTLERMQELENRLIKFTKEYEGEDVG